VFALFLRVFHDDFFGAVVVDFLMIFPARTFDTGRAASNTGKLQSSGEKKTRKSKKKVDVLVLSLPKSCT